MRRVPKLKHSVIVKYEDGQVVAGKSSDIDAKGYYYFRELVNWQMLDLKKPIVHINAESVTLGKTENKRSASEKPRDVPAFDADINDYGRDLPISGIPFFMSSDLNRLVPNSTETIHIKNPYLMYDVLIYEFWILLLTKLEEMRIEYPDHVHKEDWSGMQTALSMILSANTFKPVELPIMLLKKLVYIWKEIFEKNASYKNWKILSGVNDKHHISPITLILKYIGYDSIVYPLDDPYIGGNPSVKFL